MSVEESYSLHFGFFVKKLPDLSYKSKASYVEWSRAFLAKIPISIVKHGLN